MHALNNWQFDAVKILVKSGANIDIKDKYGFTAIQKAQFKGLTSLVKYIES